MDNVTIIKLGHFVPNYRLGQNAEETNIGTIIYNSKSDDNNYNFYLKYLLSILNENKYNITLWKSDNNMINSNGNIKNGLDKNGTISGYITYDQLSVGKSLCLYEVIDFDNITTPIWTTSLIKYILSDNIFITNNSVYAIHDLIKMRNDKLNIIGI